MDLAIRLLGPLEVDVAAKAADLGGPRQRAVLTMLLIARGAVVSVDRLIEDLWHGEPPQRATGGLQVYVSNLRRTLEPDRAPRTPATLLVSAAPGYALRAADDAVDTWRFEQLVRAAADAPAASAVVALEQALDLWRGAALAEFAAEPWAAPEAARLEDLRLVARERLVDARIRAGRPADAVGGAEALVGEYPLREDGWRLLALSQYLAGRQGDALATLRRARQVLADELGVDPGPRLVQLERDVLAQAVAPIAEAAPEPAYPSAGAAVALASRTFVGRAAELRALRESAAAVRPGVPAVALVAGEAGGGKSALLGRLRDELAADGWRVLVGRCPEADGGPPARPWAEVLRALAAEVDPGPYASVLAGLLSDEVADRDPNDALVGRFRVHQAVRDWLASLDDRPMVIFLDDVHRADAETRALLAALLDPGLSNRVMFALGYRPESTDALDDLLAGLARYAPTRVRLEGLGRDEVAQLIASVTGEAIDAALVDALALRTDGNPFYIKESARLLASEGELVATSQVPEGVGDVLRRRLARLPEESVSVLRLASVIGRDVDIALLIEAAEVDEDTVLDALETGLISALLLEPAPGAVRFSHLLVRETLYAGVPNLRRVRWHARVATAVAALYPADLTALAHHSVQSATPATAIAAARSCVAAAELAQSRFAFDTEADLYLDAQRCIELMPQPDERELVNVLTRRVRALIRAGATTAAKSVRDEAVAFALRTNDPKLLTSAVNSGTIVALRNTLRTYGEFDAVFIATVEELLRSGGLEPAERARTLCTLIRETSSIDDPRCATAIEEALALTQSLHDPELIGLALWAAAEEFSADVHWDEREVVRAQMQQLVEWHPDPVLRIAAHIMAANRSGALLDMAEARRQASEIAAIAHQYQLRQGEFQSAILDALHSVLVGELDAAERKYYAAYETQLRRGTVDAASAQLLAMTGVRFAQGRLPELVEDLRRASTGAVPAVAHLLAFALAAQGEAAEARHLLAAVPIQFRDYLWLVFATMRAHTIAMCGATDLAPASYTELLPYAERVAGAGTNGFAIGPVPLALGRLAVLLGRPDDARAHFERARALAQKCGSVSWIEQADAGLDLLAVS